MYGDLTKAKDRNKRIKKLDVKYTSEPSKAYNMRQYGKEGEQNKLFFKGGAKKAIEKALSKAKN